MIITRDIYYARVEGDTWHKLSLTPNEIEQVLDFIDQIKPPVASGYIKLPHYMNRFFPMVYFQAIKINGEVWNTTEGWVE